MNTGSVTPIYVTLSDIQNLRMSELLEHLGIDRRRIDRLGNVYVIEFGVLLRNSICIFHFQVFPKFFFFFFFEQVSVSVNHLLPNLGPRIDVLGAQIDDERTLLYRCSSSSVTLCLPFYHKTILKDKCPSGLMQDKWSTITH